MTAPATAVPTAPTPGAPQARTGRPTAPRTCTGTVGVAVLHDDQLGHDAASAYLATRPELAMLPAGDAEVLLVFTEAVTEDTLDRIQLAVDGATGASPRLVLVTGTMREQHLWRAVGLGLSSVVPRAAATWDRVVAALLGARAGRGEMPAVAVGWLLDQVRTLQTDVLEPAGLTAAGLAVREVEVLRLLAEGMDTVEIARALNYSERTIKNIIHGMISRLNLRNRSHAVAYALRAGAL